MTDETKWRPWRWSRRHLSLAALIAATLTLVAAMAIVFTRDNAWWGTPWSGGDSSRERKLYRDVQAVPGDFASRMAASADWPQWGGSPSRNNVAQADRAPVDWNYGRFERKTGQWLTAGARNTKWVASLGSQTYSTPVVADGKVFIGTNNAFGYLKRYPPAIDLGVLLCLRETDGSFLWQHSSEKLPTGRIHDWPMVGLVSTPLVEGDRLWVVTNRGEVKCLDVSGYYDEEDDGPVRNEPAWLFDVGRSEDPAQDKIASFVKELAAGRLPADLRQNFAAAGMPLPEGDIAVVADEEAKPPLAKWRFSALVDDRPRELYLELRGPRLSAFKIVTPDDKEEADVIWSLDMMRELGVSQHNMCTCAPTAWGDTLFICTSNGLDESHKTAPAPAAPSFLALDKHTGKILWTDRSPGANIQHGQWSSAAVGVLGGVPQVIFPGGDGWVYSFHAEEWQDGQPILLWKFDTNPKEAVLELGGRGTRNEPFALPVIYDGLVYLTTGQDPEHGEGVGLLWCIDPTKRGDISAELAVRRDDHQTVLPHKRIRAVDPGAGEAAIANPNSGVVWKYDRQDWDGDGMIDDFYEHFHRSMSSVVIKKDILFAVDYAGLCHCLNAKTGKVYWTADLLAEVWGTPLVVGDRVYIGDGDGEIAIFDLHLDPNRSLVKSKVGLEPKRHVDMGNMFCSTPIFANGVLYIATRDHLFAIAEPAAAATSGNSPTK
ncbi:MAG TPA: PQQ-binding-like beta-propeller repeat protein [Pirellulaceae bacterium]|nr:PQQ-binding-like beta-propeller repeat protein [Pirellulaceae bacterium]